MSRSKTFRFVVRVLPVFALVLAACAPAVSAPTAAPTVPVITATASLPPPTATATDTAVPTDTPAPPTATATATRVPATRVPATATATATAAPTDTPTPGPGAVLFDIAKDKCDWKKAGFDWSNLAPVSDYTVDTRADSLYVEVQRINTQGYAYCAQDFAGDVQIDSDLQKTTGSNRNNVSLICRLSNEGWYEASINSGGYWYIYKFVPKDGFTLLKQGATTAIHLQNATNHLTLVCAGDSIGFYVNQVKLGTVQDSQFAHGQVGVAVSTFNLKGVGVSFSGLKVALPDPANPPGGKVAPTVVPTASSGGGGAPGGGSGCRLNGVQAVSGSQIGLFAFSADGFVPNDFVSISLEGVAQADGTTPPGILLFDQADGQGHYEGAIFPTGDTSNLGPHPSWVFTIDSSTCKFSQTVTWQ